MKTRLGVGGSVRLPDKPLPSGVSSRPLTAEMDGLSGESPGDVQQMSIAWTPRPLPAVRSTTCDEWLRGRPHQAERQSRQKGVDQSVQDVTHRVGPGLPLPDRVAQVREGIAG